MKKNFPLSTFLTEYKEKNDGNKYKPVAVGRYGIRTRESIYSKELAKDYSKNKLIFKNTLTVGMGSAQIDIGVLTDDIIYSVSPAYHTYRVTGINANFLRYCLECRNHDMFVRFVKRGSRQGKTIDFKRWLTYEIPVYDDTTQTKIVERLDMVSKLIKERQRQLECFDELVKSRFVEMFVREKNSVKMKDICSIITDGTHQPPKFVSKGIPFIFVANITKNEVNYNTEKFIDQHTYDELVKRTPIEVGDIILSTVGSYGHSAVIKSNKKFLFQRHIAYLKPKRNLVNSEYLHSAILMDDIQKQIDDQVKGIAQKTLNLSAIKAIDVLLPSVDKQKEFVEFKQQVNKSKFESKLYIKIIRKIERRVAYDKF